MESFDHEASAIWRPALEDEQSIILALFTDINTEDDMLGLALVPVFQDLIRPEIWPKARTVSVLETLAHIVGQSRGAGEEKLTPTCEGMLLSGMGVVLAECSPSRHLSSSSFYLYDRVGNFYVRRFMGGNQGEPQVVGGSIDTTLTDEQAAEQALSEEHFTDLHTALARIVHASLVDPAECRQRYGENLFGELTHIIEKLRAQQDPTHPLHPSRTN